MTHDRPFWYNEDCKVGMNAASLLVHQEWITSWR